VLALPAETPFAPSNYSRGSGVHTAAVNGAKVITHTPCALTTVKVTAHISLLCERLFQYSLSNP
jgi:hypothetical protein